MTKNSGERKEKRAAVSPCSSVEHSAVKLTSDSEMRDRQSGGGGGGGRLSSLLDFCPSFCFPACLSQSHITSLT